MTHVLTTLLTALLAGSLGWVCGHATARVRIIVLGATWTQNETALSAEDERLVGEWRAQLDQTIDRFDSRGDAP